MIFNNKKKFLIILDIFKVVRYFIVFKDIFQLSFCCLLLLRIRFEINFKNYYWTKNDENCAKLYIISRIIFFKFLKGFKRKTYYNSYQLANANN